MNEAEKQVTVRQITPLDLIRQAVDSGADIDKLEKLLQLEREWKADKAREAYVEAMNDFRAEAIQVVRTKEGHNYKYAPLSEVLAIAVPKLAQHGLSHRWETKQGENGGIEVTCIVTHSLGHSERTSLMAAPDTSGSKNAVQAIGSTVTYLERYTFMAATGLASGDQDDDGLGASADTIPDEQAATIKDLLEQSKADVPKFLAWLSVDSVEEIPAKRYGECVNKLKRKLAK